MSHPKNDNLKGRNGGTHLSRTLGGSGSRYRDPLAHHHLEAGHGGA
jgi:hypothetical protein